MSEWHYVEKDGNPKAEGFYVVACEAYVSFADDPYDEGENRIKSYGEPYRGLCYWDGEKWIENENDSFNIDDHCSAWLCKADHIYAWADAIPETPKQIDAEKKLNKAAKERQVIVTWYKPEEKLPPEDCSVVITFSGKLNNIIYDHAIGIASYFPGEVYAIDGMDEEASDRMTIEAWADLDPYV